MALPKKTKLDVNLESTKIGSEYLKYGLDRIEELIQKTDKNTTYLPRTILFSDIDIAVNEYVTLGNLELVVDGVKIPTFYLENERFGEFSKTWKFMDGDKNVPTPYVTIRRTNKEKGTRLGNKWRVPQGKTFRYLDVPILDNGQVIYLRFKIPEPTNVDMTYEVSLFTKYREDVNSLDEIVFPAFASGQEYIFPKNHPMPIQLNNISEPKIVENIDGDKLYISKYTLKVLGYIQKEEEFEITRTSRKPRFGVGLSRNN